MELRRASRPAPAWSFCAIRGTRWGVSSPRWKCELCKSSCHATTHWSFLTRSTPPWFWVVAILFLMRGWAQSLLPIQLPQPRRRRAGILRVCPMRRSSFQMRDFASAGTASVKRNSPIQCRRLVPWVRSRPTRTATSGSVRFSRSSKAISAPLLRRWHPPRSTSVLRRQRT